MSKVDLDKHITERLNHNCDQCGYSYHSQNELKTHKSRYHRDYQSEGFQQQITVCRYFVQNRCTRGQQCKFDHPSSVNTHPNPLMCTRGPGCAFLAQGNCHYFHQGVGVQSRRSPVMNQQMVRQQNSFQNREPQTSQKSCHFQERCWNNSCRFSHQDFYKTNSFLVNY